MTKVYNYRHRQITCPECKNSDNVLVDDRHGIVYCEHCGFIIQDTHLETVFDEIEASYYNEKRIRGLWRRKFNVMREYTRK